MLVQTEEIISANYLLIHKACAWFINLLPFQKLYSSYLIGLEYS